jgi:nucleotide-binding universal stress UspA family protein
MNAPTHLLVATDLSSSSLHAVDRGFQLASQTGARYTILHALGLDALAQLRELLGGDTSALSLRIADEVRDALAQIVDDPSRNRGVSAELRLEPGTATSAVPRYAEATDADLILLGAHGKGFLQRTMLGSTASRLLRKSKRPVLVVKEPCRAPYRRVLIAVDFSPGSDRAVRIAREVAPAADLDLLHVFDVPFEVKLRFAGVSQDGIDRFRIEARDRALQQLHRMAKDAGLSAGDYDAQVLHGDPTRRILAQEENDDCDLIVMGKHGTNVTEELLLGSVTNHILAESRSDVLVVVDERAAVVGGAV